MYHRRLFYRPSLGHAPANGASLCFLLFSLGFLLYFWFQKDHLRWDWTRLCGDMDRMSQNKSVLSARKLLNTSRVCLGSRAFACSNVKASPCCCCFSPKTTLPVPRMYRCSEGDARPIACVLYSSLLQIGRRPRLRSDVPP